MDKRARNVPLSILQDRESLYEEVINAKQINNRLQEEKIALQTRLKQMQVSSLAKSLGGTHPRHETGALQRLAHQPYGVLLPGAQAAKGLASCGSQALGAQTTGGA